MLQQSMGHLDAALGDLGYSLGNLDVAYNGQDARDARVHGVDVPGAEAKAHGRYLRCAGRKENARALEKPGR